MNMCIKEATAEKKNFEVFTVHENFLCLLRLLLCSHLWPRFGSSGNYLSFSLESFRVFSKIFSKNFLFYSKKFFKKRKKIFFSKVIPDLA